MSKTKPAAQSDLIATSEIHDPAEAHAEAWDRARNVLQGIKTALRMSLAGQVLIGQELEALKKDLGFMGSGRRKEKPHDGAFKSLNRTWDQWCASELGIGSTTADRWIDCYDAAKLRIKKLGGQAKFINLLSTPPAKMTDEDRNILSGVVDKLVWGDTQKDLLEELKIAKTHHSLTGGDTTASKPPKETQVQQLAFAFFSPIPQRISKLTKTIGSITNCGRDYQKFLASLELTSSDPADLTLTRLESELETLLTGDIQTLLRDIKQTKAARLQSIES